MSVRGRGRASERERRRQGTGALSPDLMWVVRAGGDDGEFRPWHFIYVCNIESRLIRSVIYEFKARWVCSSENSNS
jgi:hypothetical protein